MKDYPQVGSQMIGKITYMIYNLIDYDKDSGLFMLKNQMVLHTEQV
jgi:hypothetical protein